MIGSYVVQVGLKFEIPLSSLWNTGIPRVYHQARLPCSIPSRTEAEPAGSGGGSACLNHPGRGWQDGPLCVCFSCTSCSEVHVGGRALSGTHSAGPWVFLHKIDTASSLRVSQVTGVPHSLPRLHNVLDGGCLGQVSLV